MKVNNLKEFYLSPLALDRYKPIKVKAADSVIRVTGEIGYETTLNKVLDKLEGAGDVELVINSPGGDMFEGLAIYSALKEHKGRVKIKVLGVAASSASIIAMAADELEISEGGWLMIHNAWVLAVGNKNNLREVADTLEEFDNNIANIYALRTGADKKQMAKLMDAETWLNAEDSVKMKFANRISGAEETEEADEGENARARLDLILAKAGIPRTERRKLMTEYKTGGTAGGDTQNAVSTDTQNAVKAMAESLKNLQNLLPRITE